MGGAVSIETAKMANLDYETLKASGIEFGAAHTALQKKIKKGKSATTSDDQTSIHFLAIRQLSHNLKNQDQLARSRYKLLTSKSVPDNIKYIQDNLRYAHSLDQNEHDELSADDLALINHDDHYFPTDSNELDEDNEETPSPAVISKTIKPPKRPRPNLQLLLNTDVSNNALPIDYDDSSIKLDGNSFTRGNVNQQQSHKGGNHQHNNNKLQQPLSPSANMRVSPHGTLYMGKWKVMETGIFPLDNSSSFSSRSKGSSSSKSAVVRLDKSFTFDARYQNLSSANLNGTSFRGTGAEDKSQQQQQQQQQAFASSSGNLSTLGGSFSGGGGGINMKMTALPAIGGKRDFLEISTLGSGASGVVSEAIHLPSLTLVALKMLPIYNQEKRQHVSRELGVLYKNLAELKLVDETLYNDDIEEDANNNNMDTAITTAEGKTNDGNSSESAGYKHTPPSTSTHAISSLTAQQSKSAANSSNSNSSQHRSSCLHILSLYNAFVDPKSGMINLVVEYMDGGSLEDLVKQGGCKDEKVLADIAYQTIQGLCFLHTHKNVHRDIKPANILCSSTGIVKIADFGIAKALDKTSSFANSFVGTVCYMSPERITGEHYSFPCDIWSLGLTILAVAKGRFPMSGKESSSSSAAESPAAGEGNNKKNTNNKAGGSGFGEDDSTISPCGGGEVGVIGGAAGYWAMIKAICDDEPPTAGVGHTSEFNDFIDACLRKDPFKRLSAKELLTMKLFERNATSLMLTTADRQRLLGNNNNSNNNTARSSSSTSGSRRGSFLLESPDNEYDEDDTPRSMDSNSVRSSNTLQSNGNNYPSSSSSSHHQQSSASRSLRPSMMQLDLIANHAVPADGSSASSPASQSPMAAAATTTVASSSSSSSQHYHHHHRITPPSPLTARLTSAAIVRRTSHDIATGGNTSAPTSPMRPAESNQTDSARSSSGGGATALREVREGRAERGDNEVDDDEEEEESNTVYNGSRRNSDGSATTLYNSSRRNSNGSAASGNSTNNEAMDIINAIRLEHLDRVLDRIVRRLHLSNNNHKKKNDNDFDDDDDDDDNDDTEDCDLIDIHNYQHDEFGISTKKLSSSNNNNNKITTGGNKATGSTAIEDKMDTTTAVVVEEEVVLLDVVAPLSLRARRMMQAAKKKEEEEAAAASLAFDRMNVIATTTIPLHSEEKSTINSISALRRGDSSSVLQRRTSGIADNKNSEDDDVGVVAVNDESEMKICRDDKLDSDNNRNSNIVNNKGSSSRLSIASNVDDEDPFCSNSNGACLGNSSSNNNNSSSSGMVKHPHHLAFSGHNHTNNMSKTQSILKGSTSYNASHGLLGISLVGSAPSNNHLLTASSSGSSDEGDGGTNGGLMRAEEKKARFIASRASQYSSHTTAAATASSSSINTAGGGAGVFNSNRSVHFSTSDDNLSRSIAGITSSQPQHSASWAADAEIAEEEDEEEEEEDAGSAALSHPKSLLHRIPSSYHVKKKGPATTSSSSFHSASDAHKEADDEDEEEDDDDDNIRQRSSYNKSKKGRFSNLQISSSSKSDKSISVDAPIIAVPVLPPVNYRKMLPKLNQKGLSKWENLAAQLHLPLHLVRLAVRSKLGSLLDLEESGDCNGDSNSDSSSRSSSTCCNNSNSCRYNSTT